MYNEVALKKVGHIASYTANCSCIKHNLYLLACNIPKFFVMLMCDVLLLNLALLKKIIIFGNPLVLGRPR